MNAFELYLSKPLFQTESIQCTLENKCHETYHTNMLHVYKGIIKR